MGRESATLDDPVHGEFIRAHRGIDGGLFFRQFREIRGGFRWGGRRRPGKGQLAEVVAKEPEKLAYVVPKEGATLWMDNVTIPAKARNLENAYRFLNYIMEPQVNAEIVNGVSYASANVPAKKFIKPEILNDASIYPSDEVIGRCEFLEDIGDTTTLLDQYWTEIKAQ